MVETLARLPLTERLLIWFLVAMIFGLAGYSVFYVPTEKARREADNQLDVARARRDQVARDLAVAVELTASLAREEHTLTHEVAEIPGADGVPVDLLFILPELARRSGAAIERWRPLPDENIGAWGVGRPVRVELRASWSSFAEFLRKLGEQREVVAIDNLVILDPQRDDGALEISFRASALRVRHQVARDAPNSDPVADL